MRRYLLAVSIALLPLSVFNPAQAQDAQTALAMSRHGTMTCAQFVPLAPPAQEKIVRQITSSAPPASLSTSVGDDIVDNSGNVVTVRPDRTDVPGTPLTAGELIGDCQIARPQSTLREAYSAANSGSSTVVIAPH